MTWPEQLAGWSEWLDQHQDDPEVIAAAARIGRHLAGGDR